MNKPIMQFKDDKELRDTMLWWKDKLYLGDWIISTKLQKELLGEDLELEDGDICDGTNVKDFRNKSAQIELGIAGRNENYIITYCEEQVLVHELLHSIIPSFENNEIMTENIVDFMSRTLIETKYNLDKSFWDNSMEEVQSEKIHTGK